MIPEFSTKLEATYLVSYPPGSGSIGRDWFYQLRYYHIEARPVVPAQTYASQLYIL